MKVELGANNEKTLAYALKELKAISQNIKELKEIEDKKYHIELLKAKIDKGVMTSSDYKIELDAIDRHTED